MFRHRFPAMSYAGVRYLQHPMRSAFCSTCSACERKLGVCNGAREHSSGFNWFRSTVCYSSPSATSLLKLAKPHGWVQPGVAYYISGEMHPP